MTKKYIYICVYLGCVWTENFAFAILLCHLDTRAQSPKARLFKFWDERYESEVAQLCPTLCDPMDCSLPGSSVHRIFQARVLEWVAISFSRGSSQPRDQSRVSCITDKTLYRLSHQGSRSVMSDSAIPWTVAYQASPSMEFSRQGFWSGLPFPSPGDLPDPGIEPRSPALQAEKPIA